MSIDLMSVAWTLDLPPAQKVVLVAMADHASNDGTRCYPSVERIAAKTGLSERTVQSAIMELRRAGILSVVAHEHGGRGHATEYSIDVSKGAVHAFFTDKKDATDAPFTDTKDATVAPIRGVKGATSALKGANSALKGAAVAPQPLITIIESSIQEVATENGTPTTPWKIGKTVTPPAQSIPPEPAAGKPTPSKSKPKREPVRSPEDQAKQDLAAALCAELTDIEQKAFDWARAKREAARAVKVGITPQRIGAMAREMRAGWWAGKPLPMVKVIDAVIAAGSTSRAPVAAASTPGVKRYGPHNRNEV